MLPDLCKQTFDIFNLRYVRRYANGSPLRPRQSIESFDCLIDALIATCFSCCDEDCSCAGEQESGSSVESQTSRALRLSVGLRALLTMRALLASSDQRDFAIERKKVLYVQIRHDLSCVNM